MNSSFEPNPAELFAFLTDETSGAPEGDDTQEGGGSSYTPGDAGKGAVMFCVDCGDLENLSSEDIERTFSLVKKYMRNQIIASDGSEMTGLVLYNVGTTQNPLRQRGIYLFQDLSGLTARRIHEISELIDLDSDSFRERIGGASNETDISELIFVCNAQFRKLSSAYTPRIIIFTNNDEPCGSDRKAMQAAITRGEDFLNAFPKSQIQLCPIGESSTESFDVSKFWAELLRVYSSDEFADFTSEFREGVENKTLKKLFRKRPVNRINLYLSDSAPPVGLMMYTSFFPASKPRHIYLDPESRKPLKAETRYIADLTGAVLDPDPAAGDIISYVDYNGIQAPLSKSDVAEIRKLWPPSENTSKSGVTGNLHLVGFLPSQNFLKPDYCVGHACFLYPQESRVSGSGELVSALLQVLSSRGLVALARAVPKANSSMNFVALIPQLGVPQENVPPGLHMMRLPFADDLRDLHLPNTNVSTLMATYEEQERMRVDQVDHAKQIVDAMTEADWYPEMLENPSLRACFGTLENIALNIPPSDTVQDFLNPDGAKVGVADELAQDWLRSLGLESTESITAKLTSVKYQKAEKKDIRQWTESDAKQMIASGTLSKLTIAELQSLMERVECLKHLSTKGLKTDLINKITLNLK